MSYCGKLLKSSRDLKFQVYTDTGAKPYSCRHCSECFTRPDQLKIHLLKSHNEDTWFTCHICEKKFTQSGHLKTHLLRHEGVKPYVCLEYPKCFCTAGELKRHALKHSNVKLFCCGLCAKDCKCKDKVPKHFKRCSIRLGFTGW